MILLARFRAVKGDADKNVIAAWIATAVVFLFEILPYLIFGESCAITVHDNLDWSIAFEKLIHEGNFFGDLSAKSNVLNHLQSAYFCSSYTLKDVLFYFFSPFIAYTLIYIISLFLGFFSIKLLLKKLSNYIAYPEWLCIIVSLIYAILPTIPDWRIAVASLPLGFVLLINLLERGSVRDIIFLIFYAFISHVNSVGIFLCITWFAAIVIVCIRKKQVLIKQFFGLLILGVGYIIFNLPLVYISLFLKVDLNRAHFLTPSTNLLSGIVSYFVNGTYHVSAGQKTIILIGFLTFLFFIWQNIRNRIKNKSTGQHLFTYGINNELKLSLVFLGLILLNSFLAALSDAEILNPIISNILPFLNGFSFARFYVINRVYWYMLFFAVLAWILKIPKGNIKKYLVNALLVLQIIFVIVNPTYYNDSVLTWKRYAGGVQDDTTISYKEFYDTELFEKIKQDIKYQGEMVAAVGYHPNVLIYNGFHTVDGYWSYYPYKDMLEFRTLIAPELEYNPDEAEYYDEWGGRRYLYNFELSYNPTREQYKKAITLRIDPQVFVNTFHGQYILSRAAIGNAAALGMEYVKTYSHEGSIYTIYLYKVK